MPQRESYFVQWFVATGGKWDGEAGPFGDGEAPGGWCTGSSQPLDVGEAPGSGARSFHSGDKGVSVLVFGTLPKLV